METSLLKVHSVVITPASKVLMVRPRSFYSNAETAPTNAFQQTSNLSQTELVARAKAEFEQLRLALINHRIEVVCYDEPISAKTPDAVFPNNWFAVLPDGRGFLFPMCTPNRRREVQPSWIQPFVRSKPMIDLRKHCPDGVYLEGTGSLILDHNHKLGYACLSERTQLPAIHQFEQLSGYKVFTFAAKDIEGRPFYHTNVMMAIGQKTAVVCLESFTIDSERQKISEMLQSTGHQIVEIAQKQVLEFSGNMLLLSNSERQNFWVCSERAFLSLSDTQIKVLRKDGDFIYTALSTIENIGGGSARCMLGEIFWPA